MKKTIIASLILLMVAGVTFANPAGAPNAERLYKFNIIGVQNPKKVDMDNDSGKVIFVNLEGKSQINLVCSDDKKVLADYPELVEGSFDILDKNGTDADGALLALPDPNLDPYIVGEKGDADVWSAYSIYIRPLGKPGGWADITTCADLLDSTFAGLLPGQLVSVLNRQEGTAYCSIEQVGKEITERPKGQSVFTNVTAQLLTIVFKVEVDTTGDGIADETVCVRVPIFDDILENEYWEYDNHGLKLLQVWIYDNSTDVSAGDGALSGC